MSSSPGVFRVTCADPASRARTGVLETAHGPVDTPVFMPVATQASVKAVTSEDLGELGARAILANSYHLNLRPGPEVIEAAGGLNRFMDYPGAILTDSGGYQVLSLAKLRRIDDDGVTFKSYLDGSSLTLTPESVIRLQARLGADIWTTLDECPPYPCSAAAAREALERTMRWTDRSLAAFASAAAPRLEAGTRPLFFPILQGSQDPALRVRAAEHVAGIAHDGAALGGFSVGEPKEKTWAVLDRTLERLPLDTPRYLMGVGAPQDLWEAVGLGVDMLDCVWPTRMARNGQVMTSDGRFSIKNVPLRRDFSPIEAGCPCPACKRHSRAYLCHLFRAGELSAYRLLSLHNLHFTFRLMRTIREAIRAGEFTKRKKEWLTKYCAATKSPRSRLPSAVIPPRSP